MPVCHACGVRLTPSVRQPHTVYVRKLFLVGTRHYCRHHAIAAAVAAGLVTEIAAGEDSRNPAGNP